MLARSPFKLYFRTLWLESTHLWWVPKSCLGESRHGATGYTFLGWGNKNRWDSTSPAVYSTINVMGLCSQALVFINTKPQSHVWLLGCSLQVANWFYNCLCWESFLHNNLKIKINSLVKSYKNWSLGKPTNVLEPMSFIMLWLISLY